MRISDWSSDVCSSDLAMLVVMEHRNVHAFFQRGFDDEAIGRGDIFEVDAAKARREQLDRLDETLRIFGVDLEIDRIDVGEPLEQHRLAFHHRLRCQRAEIAEPERSEEHTSELQSLMR